MRTKNFFITPAALLLLASCSSELDVTQTTKVDEPTPVTFGAYSAQSTKTRAAITELSDIAGEGKPGFGVFAYYTGTDNYNASIAPNFMYNEHVTGRELTGGGYDWSYSPLKFWPNDISTGVVDGGGADGSATGTVANGGKISFFAYAPYVQNTPSDGTVSGVTDGILSFTSNVTNGNPTVTYKVRSADFMDLLWGTAGENSVNYIEKTGSQAGTQLTGGKAKVWTDITRPKDTDRIKFNFLHALSKFGGSSSTTNPGGVKIVLNPDAGGSFGGNNETKVTVNYIKIATTNGTSADNDNKFCQKGTLDLATGVWTKSSENDDYTIINQEINGTGTATDPATGAKINPAILENTSFESASKWDGEVSDGGLPNGVTTTAVNVYDSDIDPIYAIPGSQPNLTVTISYVVRTKDDKLKDGYTYAKQEITKNITMPVFELNKAYGLLIRLGLTSVKFAAEITNWEDGGSDTDPADSGKHVTIVDLPAND